MPIQTNYKVYIAASGQTYDLSGLFADLEDGTVASNATEFKVNGTDLTGLFHALTTQDEAEQVADSTNFFVGGNDLKTIFRRRGYTGIIITQQPTNQTVLETETATFTIVATGTGTLLYQWQKYNVGTTSWENISGATSDTLEILNADYPTDEGSYRCFLTDDRGSLSSSPATLTVNYLPVITVHPESVTLDDTNVATFSVTATEGKPAGLTYQWQRPLDGVGEDWRNLSEGNETDISGIDEPQLTFKCQVGRADWRYRCVVSNTAGSVNSNAAILYINPKITTNLNLTKTVTVLSGQETVLAVFTIVAGGSATLGYQWYKDGSQIGADNPTFADTVDEDSNGSEYYCIVSSSAPNTATAESETCVLTVSLTNISISNFSGNGTSSPASLTVNKNETVNFVVTAVGAGTLWYDFYKDTATPVLLQGGPSNTYSHTVSESDEGTQFFCAVSSSKTSLQPQNTSILTFSNVNYTSTITSISATNGAGTYNDIYNKGNQTEFKVTVTQSKPSSKTFEWYLSLNGGTTWNLARSVSNTSLEDTYTGPTADLNILYYCRVINSAGSVSSNVKTITINPRIVNHPTAQTVNAGQTATFTVTAEGSGTLYYTWYRNQSLVHGPVTANYYVTPQLTPEYNNSESSPSSYYCEVSSNIAGTSPAQSNSAILIVQHIVIVTQPSGGTFNADTPIQLEVDVKAYPPVTYQWQYYDNGWVNVSDGDFENGSGSNSDKLSFKATALVIGNYRCQINNDFGTVYSNSVYVNVV